MMKLQSIWPVLRGGLWHATHPNRFAQIMKCGAIVPEPNIPNEERQKTGKGPSGYPYVRHIGGVSLFDFLQIHSLETYSEKHPSSQWDAFIPYPSNWRCAVWIEIDRAKIAGCLISADGLVQRWKKHTAYRHTIMPYIEAAHIGRLSTTTFIRALSVAEGCEEFDMLDIQNGAS